MDGYIRRDQLPQRPISGIFDEYARGFAACLDQIAVLPTVDAVSVVRCRDCKYSCEDTFYQAGTGLIQSLACKYGQCNDSAVDEDFFCKNGKRKEG